MAKPLSLSYQASPLRRVQLYFDEEEADRGKGSGKLRASYLKFCRSSFAGWGSAISSLELIYCVQPNEPELSADALTAIGEGLARAADANGCPNLRSLGLVVAAPPSAKLAGAFGQFVQGLVKHGQIRELDIFIRSHYRVKPTGRSVFTDSGAGFPPVQYVCSCCQSEQQAIDVSVDAMDSLLKPLLPAKQLRKLRFGVERVPYQSIVSSFQKHLSETGGAAAVGKALEIDIMPSRIPSDQGTALCSHWAQAEFTSLVNGSSCVSGLQLKTCSRFKGLPPPLSLATGLPVGYGLTSLMLHSVHESLFETVNQFVQQNQNKPLNLKTLYLTDVYYERKSNFIESFPVFLKQSCAQLTDFGYTQQRDDGSLKFILNNDYGACLFKSIQQHRRLKKCTIWSSADENNRLLECGRLNLANWARRLSTVIIKDMPMCPRFLFKFLASLAPADGRRSGPITHLDLSTCVFQCQICEGALYDALAFDSDEDSMDLDRRVFKQTFPSFFNDYMEAVSQLIQNNLFTLETLKLMIPTSSEISNEKKKKFQTVFKKSCLETLCLSHDGDHFELLTDIVIPAIPSSLRSLVVIDLTQADIDWTWANVRTVSNLVQAEAPRLRELLLREYEINRPLGLAIDGRGCVSWKNPCALEHCRYQKARSAAKQALLTWCLCIKTTTTATGHAAALPSNVAHQILKGEI